VSPPVHFAEDSPRTLATSRSGYGSQLERSSATMRKVARPLGTLLIAAGFLTLVWVVVVWQWQDPFTAIYTHFKQAQLSSSYAKRDKAFRPAKKLSVANPAATARSVAQEARAYRSSLQVGEAVGRLKIGRIGLNMIVVQGTDEESLKKGPGHYLATALPGEGRLIYIAGHRTTYLAPFSHINDIRNGDYMTLAVPYGTFEYRAFRHYIVKSDDLSVLVNRGREILRLQACHPRFFATHRYIVDAQLVAFEPRGGRTWLKPPHAGH
jgi:sortase A